MWLLADNIAPCFKPWHQQPTPSAKVSFGRGGGGVRAYYSLPPSFRGRRQGPHAASSGPNCVRRERRAQSERGAK